MTIVTAEIISLGKVEAISPGKVEAMKQNAWPNQYDVDVRFRNRADAGAHLADLLQEFQGQEAVVLALPRGGVVLGELIARRLGLPLDLIIPRKIGHPANSEYAIAAVTETGEPVANKEEVSQIDPTWYQEEVTRQRKEAARRRKLYLKDRPPLPLHGKTVLIVDDGIATGLTMRAALSEISAKHPAKLIVAIPVIPRDTAVLLRTIADEVVAVTIPDVFAGAIGSYYQDFPQVSDEEVIRLMHRDDYHGNTAYLS